MASYDLAKSMKPMAIEELLDYYFYRRVAHLMVPYLIRLKITPNQITTLSLVFGLVAAFFVYHSYFIYGAFLFLAAVFFDCCDGQVARLTHTSSVFGRTLDGFFDFIWITAFWIAIYFSGYFQSHDINILALMITSAVSMILHCWRFDGVKVLYLEHSSAVYGEGDLDCAEAWGLCKQEARRFNFFTAFLAILLAFQMYFFGRGKEKKGSKTLPAEARQAFIKKAEPVINLYSYLGEGHHNTLVIMGLFLAPFTPYLLIAAFWIILIPMNLWWFYCEWRWRRAVKGCRVSL
ncbi:MAG: CDP-alcohol phosphatidyltransferase family protein [Deltaproteobacteria bacterium]|nr:CDP-alcohol phosphatidyltransferase family protein [Deltaproteobacteria bacterium]